jgi:hypothetical protein
MYTSYFAGEIISGLEDICNPEATNPYQKKVALHFENAPRHNKRTVI